jgi:hypothetical protein
MVGTLRFAHPAKLASKLAQSNSQQVDPWKFMESDFDHLRIRELLDGRCSPSSWHIHRGNQEDQIFPIKSQSNHLTSLEILFLAVILHFD